MEVCRPPDRCDKRDSVGLRFSSTGAEAGSAKAFAYISGVDNVVFNGGFARLGTEVRGSATLEARRPVEVNAHCPEGINEVRFKSALIHFAHLHRCLAISAAFMNTVDQKYLRINTFDERWTAAAVMIMPVTARTGYYRIVLNIGALRAHQTDGFA